MTSPGPYRATFLLKVSVASPPAIRFPRIVTPIGTVPRTWPAGASWVWMPSPWRAHERKA